MKTDDLKFMSNSSFVNMKRANVYWQPNRYCNYECSYCWPTSHTKVKDFVNKDIAFKTIERAVMLFDRKGVKQINWGWSGGEATFHPNFLDFQKHILEQNMRATFNMTTNLSHNLPWWKKFVEITRSYEWINVACSLHQEYVNTPSKVDKFIEKLDYLKSEGVGVKVNQVMDPDIFDDQLKVLEKFYEKDYYVSRKINSALHKKYLRYTGDTIYTDEQIENMNQSHENKEKSIVTVIDKENNQVNITDLEQIKNLGLWDLETWICSAGDISIAIEGNTINRGVGGCHQEYLGKLDEDWELYDEPKICGLKKPCTCVADLKLPKWNPEHASESEWKRT